MEEIEESNGFVEIMMMMMTMARIMEAVESRTRNKLDYRTKTNFTTGEYKLHYRLKVTTFS